MNLVCFLLFSIILLWVILNLWWERETTPYYTRDLQVHTQTLYAFQILILRAKTTRQAQCCYYWPVEPLELEQLNKK
ncbi:hypothetical protein Patl1_36196 [Pistacia atlantica]|nr:hypothetical protein Patl1_36196 [Pistacia atlantica]